MSNDDVRKSRGRPRVDATPITVRIPPDQLAAIDAWIEEDGARFSRPEAIRTLVNHALGRTALSRGIQFLKPRLSELEPRLKEDEE